MFGSAEVLALIWFGLAVWAWRPRIPSQNIILASLVIGLGFTWMRQVVPLVVPSGRVDGWAGGAGVLIAVASLLLARLAAAWLCRGQRLEPYYGWLLNGLAAVLSAVPLVAELGVQTTSPVMTRWEWPGVTVGVLLGSIALLLLTLPFWLDKRQPDLHRATPLRVWPLLGWAGLSLWVWWRRTHFCWPE